tara:strand:- start:4353 stop:4475 length:123 start_codon:yes stop_codon:yes gene_type:complete
VVKVVAVVFGVADEVYVAPGDVAVVIGCNKVGNIVIFVLF